MEIKISTEDIGYMVMALIEFGNKYKTQEKAEGIGVKLIDLHKAFDRGEASHTIIITGKEEE